jgi:hypothetical protein
MSSSGQMGWYCGGVPENTLPGARLETGGSLAKTKVQQVKDRTFSVYPQKGAGLFPICERVALSKPRCCAFLASFKYNFVIYGRIWRREPFSNVLSRWVPCTIA